MAGEASERPDGRTLRAERSREAIVEALFELVGEGIRVPTAQQVADRAGVGIRTVFRHFSDMESLFGELSERIHEELRPLQGKPIEGSLEARLRELVRQRARLFERSLPYQRGTEALRWKSPFLEEQVRADARALRAHLRRWLPEVAGVPERLEALDATLSPALWHRLRIEQRLGVKRAEATCLEMALALVQGLEGSGGAR